MSSHHALQDAIHRGESKTMSWHFDTFKVTEFKCDCFNVEIGTILDLPLYPSIIPISELQKDLSR